MYDRQTDQQTELPTDQPTGWRTDSVHRSFTSNNQYFNVSVNIQNRYKIEIEQLLIYNRINNRLYIFLWFDPGMHLSHNTNWPSHPQTRYKESAQITVECSICFTSNWTSGWWMSINSVDLIPVLQLKILNRQRTLAVVGRELF